MVGVDHIESHLYGALLEDHSWTHESIFPCSDWSSRAGTPRSTRFAHRWTCNASDRPSTTPSARRMTRPPRSSDSATRAGRSWTSGPSEATPALTTCRSVG
ncbi:MAG: hypothetical protein ACFHWZ_02155 [Phycisphaerales bacterium]